MWDEEWMKALSIAVSSTKLHIGAMLLQHHLLASLFETAADLNARSVLGTPLHCALMGPGVLRSVIRGESLDKLVDLNVIGPRVNTKATVRRLVDLGADVNVPFRLVYGQEVKTALITHWTKCLEDVLKAGSILDKQTIDKIFSDLESELLSLDELQFLRNMDIYKLPECDRPAAVKLLGILGATPEHTVDSSAMRSFFTSDKEYMLLPEYEDALSTACQEDNLSLFL